MADLITYPLNNVQYYAEDAEIYNSTRTSGVFANDSFPLTKVTRTWDIKIGKGLAWIKNHDFAGKSVALKEEVTLTVGPPTWFPRIASVVLRFSSVENKTTIYIKQGEEAEAPVAPPVERSESVYELHLYHILVHYNSSYIDSTKVTDLREDPEYCGLMYDAVTPASGFYVETSEKGAPNGVASLNASGKVPNDQLNMGVAGGLAALDSSGKVPSSQLPTMNYIPTTQKGAANGVAPLNANKKIPATYLPQNEMIVLFLVSHSATLENVIGSGHIENVSSASMAGIGSLTIEMDTKRDVNEFSLKMSFDHGDQYFYKKISCLPVMIGGEQVIVTVGFFDQDVVEFLFKTVSGNNISQGSYTLNVFIVGEPYAIN